MVALANSYKAMEKMGKRHGKNDTGTLSDKESHGLGHQGVTCGLRDKTKEAVYYLHI